MGSLGAFAPAPSALCPGAGESKCFFSGCLRPVGLVEASAFGFQSWMFWGLVSQVQILKVGVPDVEFKPIAPLGEAVGFEFS